MWINKQAPSLIALLLCPVAMAHPSEDEHAAHTLHRVTVHAAPANPDGNQVRITTKGDYRYITSNGIPDHATGRFPNRGNPNRISAQDHEYRVPLHPEANRKPTPLRGVFGVALNGVPFEPGTAEVWSPNGRTQTRGPQRGPVWSYDALSGKINLGIDKNNAHVQPTGTYHYHGIPTGLFDNLTQNKKPTRMVMLGYAADGFPIYANDAHEDPLDSQSPLVTLTSSYRLKEGQRPGGNDAPGGKYDGTFVQDWEYIDGAGDLDECNGRTGVTPEYPEGTYYYVLTEEYPFIPRMFRGTPDNSFLRGPQQGERGPQHGERGPRDGERRPHHPPPPRR